MIGNPSFNTQMNHFASQQHAVMFTMMKATLEVRTSVSLYTSFLPMAAVI